VTAELVAVANAGHGFRAEDGKIISPSRKEITQMIVGFIVKFMK